MEKIIVNENKALQDEAISSVQIFATSLNKSLSKLRQDTGGFVLSMPEIIGLADRSGNEQVSMVNARLNEFLDKDLAALKIKSPLIVGNLKQGFAGILKNFIGELLGLTERPGFRYIGKLSISNGAASLAEAEELSIRESFQNTIETKEAFELYELQTATGEKLNSLFGAMTACNIHYGSLGAMVNDLFKVDHEKGTVRATELQYETIAKRH